MSDKQRKNNQAKNKRKGKADHLKAYQFQPGQSGNPKGRPRKRAFTDLLAEKLQYEHELAPGQSLDEAVVDAWIKLVLKEGDVKALISMLERMEGKTPQTVNLTENRPRRINVPDKSAQDSDGDDD